MLEAHKDMYTHEMKGPVNGGCNSNSPKVNTTALVKPYYMREQPHTARLYDSQHAPYTAEYNRLGPLVYNHTGSATCMGKTASK